MTTFLLGLHLVSGFRAAFAADPKFPAARLHVKWKDAQPYRYESRLNRIVDLNFTSGQGHLTGKEAVVSALDRIAAAYGGKGRAIAISHIKSSSSGAAVGEIPLFTLEDLAWGQVIVANNVAGLSHPNLGTGRREALQTAVESMGIGYLGIHGSGEDWGTGWNWLATELFPWQFCCHSDRVPEPVYKHQAESAHVVLQGVLESGTRIATEVPDEVDDYGQVKLARQVPVRDIKNEMAAFGRDLSLDPVYAGRTTILLKSDLRGMVGQHIDARYLRKGGNVYAYLFRVGKAMTSYLPAGHDDDEVLDAKTGFDGGVGDYDRYVAQLLFFLAGYDSTACMADCEGLPIVDDRSRLTGRIYSAVDVRGGGGSGSAGFSFASEGIGFTTGRSLAFSASLGDSGGRILESRHGSAAGFQGFRHPVRPGIYFLKVRLDNGKVRSKRYLILGGA